MFLIIDRDYNVQECTSSPNTSEYSELIFRNLSDTISNRDNKYLVSIVIAVNFFCLRNETTFNFIVFMKEIETHILRTREHMLKNDCQWKTREAADRLLKRTKKYMKTMGNQVLDFLYLICII